MHDSRIRGHTRNTHPRARTHTHTHTPRGNMEAKRAPPSHVSPGRKRHNPTQTHPIMHDTRTRAREHRRPRAIQRPHGQHTGADAGAPPRAQAAHHKANARQQERLPSTSPAQKAPPAPAVSRPNALHLEACHRAGTRHNVRQTNCIMYVPHNYTRHGRKTTAPAGAIRARARPHTGRHAQNARSRANNGRQGGISTSTGPIGAPDASETLISEASGR